MKKQRIFTIPNLLTAIRLCLIPLFIWLYIVRRDDRAALIVLALSGVTDAMDGFIARRFDMISELGKIIDPIADKLTLGAVVICMLTRFPVLLPLLILMILRETTVGLRHLDELRRRGRIEGAKWHGKITTILLYATFLAHMLFPEIPPAVSRALVAVCGAFMLLSMAKYLGDYAAARRAAAEAGAAAGEEPKRENAE